MSTGYESFDQPVDARTGNAIKAFAATTRAVAGTEQASLKRTLDEAMEDAHLRDYKPAGIRARFSVLVTDLEAVRAWSIKHGFVEVDAHADEARLRRDLGELAYAAGAQMYGGLEDSFDICALPEEALKDHPDSLCELRKDGGKNDLSKCRPCTEKTKEKRHGGNHGSGAGTPDMYDPRFLVHHFMFDVLPFSKMGWEEYPRRGWAPISEDCPKNTGKAGHPAGGFPGRPPRPPNPWRPPRHRSPEEVWEQIERDCWNDCTNRMMHDFFGPSESAFAYRDQCYEECLDFWAGA